jgi:hypothetical protein
MDRFDLATHAKFMCVSFPLKHIFIVFYFIFKKKIGRRCRILFFLFLAFSILYMFLPDISVHCALIDYVYI